MDWNKRLEIIDNILAKKFAEEGKKLTFKTAADFYETSTSTYGRWKRAEKVPNGDELQLIATKLNLSADWLLFGIGTPEKKLTRELSEREVHIADTLRDLVTTLEDPLDKVAITGGLYPDELHLIINRAKKLPAETVQKWIHAYKINGNFLIAQIGQPFLTDDQYAEPGPLDWVRRRRGDAIYPDEEDDFFDDGASSSLNYDVLSAKLEDLQKKLDEVKEDNKVLNQALENQRQEYQRLLSMHEDANATNKVLSREIERLHDILSEQLGWDGKNGEGAIPQIHGEPRQNPANKKLVRGAPTSIQDSE